jgi:hypothetical protein
MEQINEVLTALRIILNANDLEGAPLVVSLRSEGRLNGKLSMVQNRNMFRLIFHCESNAVRDGLVAQFNGIGGVEVEPGVDRRIQVTFPVGANLNAIRDLIAAWR